MDAYLDCLEIELAGRLQTPQPMATLFLGGGTPTHLPVEQLSRLLKLLSYWLPVAAGGEYSCEGNPLDCSQDRLEGLRAAGVNRLSLGGQSFDDAKLRQLERDHTGQQLRQALRVASGYFDNLSLDLIFAAPNETLAVWRDDLARALDSPIRHLSTYGLTIERGAAFYGRMLHGQLSEVDSDAQLEMYLLAIQQLTAAGWQHYEVSNFCQPGFNCHHNRTYWQGEPWWGLGPGAASFLPSRLDVSARWPSDPRLAPADAASPSSWVRSTNHRSTTQYIRRLRSGAGAVVERDVLDLEQLVRERVVFGLRQMAGVSLAELSQQLGGSVRDLLEPYLGRYLQQGWLELSGDRLRLTRSGLVISDSLWPDLLQP